MLGYYTTIATAFRQHKFRSSPLLHFYNLKDLQEGKIRRQMTNLQFLFCVKESMIPMAVGKRRTAQH